jgi:hypothetical protein
LNPEIGPAVDAVVLRGLRKDPEARFQSGEKFAEALRTILVGRVERTVPDQPAPAAPTAEDRAVSVASAVAVFIVRGARATVNEARRLNSAFAGWLRRTAPRARRGITAFAARLQAAALGLRARPTRVGGAFASHGTGRSRWWQAAALIACVAVAILAGRTWVGRDAPRQDHAWERLRELMGGKSSRVNVLVEHGLEDGTIELTDDGRVLLSESLKAPKKDLFGVSFLSYRSGTETSKIRLAPGRHELSVKVTGSDGLDLVKALDVQVASSSEYDLQVSVTTWPRKRISADWGLVEP